MQRFPTSAASAAALVLSLAATPAVAGDCAGLTAAGLFDHTVVQTAVEVPADPDKKLPAMCEVTATISPVPDSHIGVVYRLPDEWNGKLLGMGGGGWAGNVRLAVAQPGLARGYATAQTDGGHPGTQPWDTSWAVDGTPAQNTARLADFSYRAIHEMTETGKAVVRKYYGNGQSKAYYQGCSTGGRMGLMEVQRYPADYDGVIAGAPVYNLIVQTMGLYRGRLASDPKGSLSSQQLDLVSKTATAACDAADGDTDGIITDPRQCKWDPGVLACKPGQAAGPTCLSPGQVETVRAAYRGLYAKDGHVAAYPAARGSEPSWAIFFALPQTSTKGRTPGGGGGLGDLRAAMFGDPNFDLSHFNPDTDLARLESGAFAKEYEASDPDIAAFVKRGGKLILWHGFYDPGPSPLGTIDYFDAVTQKLGGAAETAKSARLFLAPGVYHCGGGPGPDQIDTVAALEDWVEKGKAPDTILATKKDAKISRPLCPYPALPRYKGQGDPDDAASFECK